jgi:hypothetical protein
MDARVPDAVIARVEVGPADLTTPQPPVTSEARGQRRTPRHWAFQQLLDKLAASATERAAATGLRGEAEAGTRREPGPGTIRGAVRGGGES